MGIDRTYVASMQLFNTDRVPRADERLMRHPVTLTVSPGRSGTTFLHRTFEEHLAARGTIAHETLHAEIARPAEFHRGYSAARCAEALAEPMIARVAEHWADRAESGPVVDFG